MKRAIGVMAVLAVVTIVATALEDDVVLTGSGCPVGTDRWETVADDYAGDFAGYPTKAEAVRAWFGDGGSLHGSDASILRAIARSEPGEVGGGPIFVETNEGLPAVLTLERFNGAGWFVADSSWCKRRTAV